MQVLQIALVVFAVAISASTAQTWRRADLTWFESYPTSDEECEDFNGCEWAGYFAYVNGKQTPEWVQSHNIIAVHQRDGSTYRLKNLRIRQGSRQIDATVYDYCADSDCNGCCTRNAANTGFLIDMESFTVQRFGSRSGVVEWYCINC